MEQFAFDVVNPERQLFSKPITMTVIPGVDGDFGVLKGHAPVIAAVRPGVVRIYDGETVTQRFLVSGGFVEVTEDRCTVLATEAYDMDKLDASTFEKRAEDTREKLEDAKDDTTRTIMQSRLNIADALVQAIAQEKA